MKTQKINIVVALILSLSIVACRSKPKVIAGEPIDGGEPIVSIKDLIDPSIVHDVIPEEHKVKIEEVLNTEKYTYLNVTEGENNSWIAILKTEVNVGGTYFYNGGLLKKNFQSREYNRIFDTIYLVSDFRNQPINSHDAEFDQGPFKMKKSDQQKPITTDPVEGAIKISKLFSDPGEYQGKVVKITGKCVKVNPMIMNRNWVHIMDGSGDNLDLTVTTTENIRLGTVVSLEGIIAVNKDFGAGYRYNIIMEGAILK